MCEYYAASNHHETEDSHWNESAEGLEKEALLSSPSHEPTTTIKEKTLPRALMKSEPRPSIEQKVVTDLQVPTASEETVNIDINCQLPLQRTKEGLSPYHFWDMYMIPCIVFHAYYNI